MKNKLIQNFEKAVNELVAHFCEKQEMEFDYWAADIVGEIACIGDYFFNFTDIVRDIKENAPKGLIFQWQDDLVEAFELSDDYVAINYRSYLMGARFENLKMNKDIEDIDLTSNDAKPTLNDGFTIDFFGLMFLAESVIPERPIARSMCFDDFSEKHYHKMNDNQRLQFFEHVQNCHGFTLENEQCRHFFARFNPKNQYLVSCFHNGKAEIIQCYMFDEEYRTSKNRFVNRDYIKSVVRMHDSQTII